MITSERGLAGVVLVSLYLGVCTAIHGLSAVIFTRLGLPVPDDLASNKPTTEKLGRVEWDQTITGFAHSTFVSLCYLVCLRDMFFEGSVEDHWAMETWFSRWDRCECRAPTRLLPPPAATTHPIPKQTRCPESLPAIGPRTQHV